MQMSAPLRRNAVCGPGCAEIFAENGNAISYASNSKPAALSGRAPTLFSDPHEDWIEDCRFLAPALSLEALSNVLGCLSQLRVSAVVGQHEDHR